MRPGWLNRLATTTRSPTTSPQVLPSVTQTISGGALPQVADAKAPRESVDENTPWGRTPFLTEAEMNGAKSPGTGGLKIKAIIVGRPKSVATIDGKSVAVGEKIGEETVVEIRPDAVVLELDGTKRTLKVSEPAVSVEVKEGKK